MRHLAAGLALAAALTAASPASAQAPQHDGVPGHGAMPGHEAMQHGTMPAGTTPGHQDTAAAMERMNHDMMAAPMTGNPDQDFVAMMTPHHQGAIDMARIYLRDGRDPALRRMAQRIIADQEREIREFRVWQAKHPASG
jgi:uncharacterized protein (DUF305 family)